MRSLPYLAPTPASLATRRTRRALGAAITLSPGLYLVAHAAMALVEAAAR